MSKRSFMFLTMRFIFNKLPQKVGNEPYFVTNMWSLNISKCHRMLYIQPDDVYTRKNLIATIIYINKLPCYDYE